MFINPKLKKILTHGPYIRYEAYLWELDKVIYEKSGFKFKLEIIDHFSKWLWCYPLINKEIKTVLINIKKYIISFGKPKIFQTDNGTEFINKEIKLYCENNNIKYINSSPYHPRTNGAIEIAHKNLQKNIQIDLLIDEDNFNLEKTINNTLNYYNYQFIHNTTVYKPIILRDTEDEILINEVIENETKIFKRFEIENHFETDLDLGKKFLLISDVKKNTKKGILVKGKKKFTYNNTSIVIDINNDGLKLKLSIILQNIEKMKFLKLIINY